MGLTVSALPQLLGALSARRWMDFKTEIAQVRSLLSLLSCRWVVQNVKLRKLSWLLGVLLVVVVWGNSGRSCRCLLIPN